MFVPGLSWPSYGRRDVSPSISLYSLSKTWVNMGGGGNGGPPSDAPVQGKVGVENFLRAAGNRRRGTIMLSAGSAPLGRAMMYVAGYSWLATLAWTLFDLLRHFGTTL